MSQDWSLTPTPATAPARRGKGAIITGAVLLVLGLVAVVAGIVGVVASTASLVAGFGAPLTTPTSFTRLLDGGTTYVVYERVASGSGSASDPVLYTVTPEDVTVTGPDGTPVPVTDTGTVTQTFDSGARTFAGVASFDVPRTGSYQIAIGTEGAEVILAPSFTTFARSFAWIALIGLGVLLGLLGLILLIVGIVRRSSSKRAVAPASAYGVASGVAYPTASYPTVAAPPQSLPGEPALPATPVAPVAMPVGQPVSPPAGWYPDPGRPGGQRYWDGSAWTEHTA